MRWYLEVLRKYVQFSGRARRTEYWMFVLFNTMFSIVFALFERRVQMVPWFTGVYALAVALPGFGVAVRRLHDIGKNWTRLLLGLIPIVGAIVLVVDLAQDSQPGKNQYGLSPEPVKKPEAPLWSIVFFLSVLSVLVGFDFWIKGYPLAGIILTFAIPGILIDLVASIEDSIRSKLRRLKKARP
jgi:uncharacterized membrane protein YhaH (DUF805 family)